MMTKAYPKYKPTGVEWLGDVPEHWEVKRSDGILISERNQMIPDSFRNEDVFHYSIPAVQEYGTGIIEEGESIASAKQLITEMCLLVSKLNPRKATICIAEPKALKTLCSTEFVVLKARKCDLSYLSYFVQSELFRQELDSKVQSVTRSHQRASPEEVYKFWTAWPPFSEQETIADFLDHETESIDALIDKKKNLLSLLAEQRTALISRAVTKGLNPSVNMKPSGVAWLGDLPEHWEIKKILFLLHRLQDGTHFSPESDFSGEYLYITAKNIKENGIDLSDITFVTREAHDEIYKRCPVKKGDVLYIKDGATAGIATVNNLEKEFSMLSSVAMLRPRPLALDSKFLTYHLNNQAFKKFVLNSLVGGAMTRFTIEIISKFRLITPPLPEQQAIAAYLDRETAKIDTLSAKVQTAIERLREYRTALISAAVTGKIDVREEV